MHVQKKERVMIGERLRAARERAHLTLDEAAGATGVLPLAIQKWERGAAMPSLIEFRQLLPLYGVMACELLFDVNPWELTPEQSSELAQAAKSFSPSLRTKVDTLLAMMAKAKEPRWKTLA